MPDVTIEGYVGPAIAADGPGLPFRQDRTGAIVTTELHGKYFETNFRGNLFWATMTAGVIFPAPAATANNPITLYNPLGSGRNLSLITFDMIMTTIPGTPVTGLYGLYVNVAPQAAAVTGTALVPQPGLIGAGSASVARPLTTSTVPVAPTLLIPFGNKVTGEVATVVPITGLPAYHLDIDGKVILAPGTAITPQMTAADTTNATVLCAFSWEEVAA